MTIEPPSRYTCKSRGGRSNARQNSATATTRSTTDQPQAPVNRCRTATRSVPVDPAMAQILPSRDPIEVHRRAQPCHWWLLCHRACLLYTSDAADEEDSVD